MSSTIMANQAAHRGRPRGGAAFKITDDMLAHAAGVDDLDTALGGVMQQVGIDDGGAAAMVFTGPYEDEWPGADAHYRLAMLREWRDYEQALAYI